MVDEIKQEVTPEETEEVEAPKAQQPSETTEPDAPVVEKKPVKKSVAPKKETVVLSDEVEPVDAPAVDEAVEDEIAPVEEANPDLVCIQSADPRPLEVSIGSNHWKGKEIFVPKELESEVRRLLEVGGFYLKN